MSPGQEEFDTRTTPAEIDPERPRPYDTPWGSFALYTVGTRLIAAPSFCPHMLGPLFQGTISGAEVTCPWHAWRFSLTTGECTWRPPGERDDGEDPRPLPFCPIRLGPRGTFVLRPPSNEPSWYELDR